MTDPKNYRIEDYSYSLPAERIAAHPLPERDGSRLLIWKDHRLQERRYTDLAAELPAGSMLVFNNTSVVEARILFRKPSGGVIEIFCLAPHERYADPSRALMEKQKVSWLCLIGGASKWKEDTLLEKEIHFGTQTIILRAGLGEKRPGLYVVELSWTEPALTFAEILQAAGSIPLPPYLNRDPDPEDAVRYQTIYAQVKGSVAAPTAGLHFTDRIFSSLREQNIAREELTLHVGAGTFLPVKSSTMAGHVMHEEWFDVPASMIRNILEGWPRPVIPVGTTTLRTLESLYWSGQAVLSGRITGTGAIRIGQWDPYERPERSVSTPAALNGLLMAMENEGRDRLVGRTSLLIAPGYRLRIAAGLVTNFHQPRSTLLLLVAALVGNEWRRLYDHALAENYRFLSYGDGCLLLTGNPS